MNHTCWDIIIIIIIKIEYHTQYNKNVTIFFYTDFKL